MTVAIENLEKLSASEKILIVEELWDQLAKVDSSVAIPEWQKEELAKRKDQMQDGEESFYTWPQILAEVQR